MEANRGHKFRIIAVLCIINNNKIILVSITNLFENLLRLFEAFYGTLKPSHALALNSLSGFKQPKSVLKQVIMPSKIILMNKVNKHEIHVNMSFCHLDHKAQEITTIFLHRKPFNSILSDNFTTMNIIITTY